MSKRITMLVVALAIILGCLTFMPPKQARAGSFNAPVLLIHGWNMNNGLGCKDSTTFGTINSYFSSQGYTYTRCLKYYLGDYNYDNSLRDDDYHCTGWFPGNEGTNNEDIRHLSCVLAWWMWEHPAPQAVIAHSMGGILIRQALFDTPYVTAFPPYLQVTDVATAGTPHNHGLIDGAAGVYIWKGCTSPCLQVNQMQASNGVMQWLNSLDIRGGFGRNPQGSGGTDWTTIGSNQDSALAWCVSSEPRGAPYQVTNYCGYMPGATHFVVYLGGYPVYDHGGYLTDANTAFDANVAYSDSNATGWVVTTSMAHSINTMYHAILYSGW